MKVKQRAGIRQSLGFGNPDDATLGTPRFSFDDRTLTLNRSVCHEVRKLFDAVLSTNLPDSIRLAIDRLHYASTRHSALDRLIDAVIGLEAVYLSENQEIAHRLASRVAAHQEDDPRKRVGLFDQMKAVYAVRSQLLHGSLAELGRAKAIGPGKQFADKDALCDFSRDRLRRAIRKLLLQPGLGLKELRARMDVAAISGKRFNPTV